MQEIYIRIVILMIYHTCILNLLSSKNSKLNANTQVVGLRCDTLNVRFLVIRKEIPIVFVLRCRFANVAMTEGSRNWRWPTWKGKTRPQPPKRRRGTNGASFSVDRVPSPCATMTWINHEGNLGNGFSLLLGDRTWPHSMYQLPHFDRVWSQERTFFPTRKLFTENVVSIYLIDIKK